MKTFLLGAAIISISAAFQMPFWWSLIPMMAAAILLEIYHSMK